MNLAAMKLVTGRTRHSTSEQAAVELASLDCSVLKAHHNQTYTFLSRAFTKAVSSALCASSGCEHEDELSDAVAQLILMLTQEKLLQMAWKANGKTRAS